MGSLIFSIIVTVVLFVGIGVYSGVNAAIKGEDNASLFKFSKWQLLSVLGLCFFIPSFFTTIPANYVGIQYSPFTGTNETVLQDGFKTKNPFDKIYKINTEVQTMTVQNITTQTQDSQYVTTALDVKYKVNSENAYLIFTQFRTLDNMSNTLVVPTVQRVLELITIRYNVIDVLGEKRSDIYAQLKNDLSEEFAKYGVEFHSISITDMDAGDAIEQAIEAEAVAKKAVETAEQELLKAQKEAEQKSVIAKAEQDAAKISAETKIIEAKAEKEANDLMQQSLTEDILMQQWINKWNGIVPTYYGGEGADLIFNTGGTASE